MAGKLVNWLKRYALIISWSVSLLIIGVAFWIEVWLAGLPGSAMITVRTKESCPLKATVSYPTKIFLPGSDLIEQKFILQVSSADGLDYQVAFLKPAWLIIQDKDGNALVPQWKGQGNSAWSATVQTYAGQPVGSTDTQVVILDAGQTFSCSTDWVPVQPESQAEANTRFLMAIFVENIALPLSLLSAIIGWMITNLEKEKAKRQEDFREHLAKIPAEFSAGILRGLRWAIKAQQLIHDLDLESKHTQEQLSDSLQRQLDLNALERLVGELSALADQDEMRELSSALNTVAEFEKAFLSSAWGQKPFLPLDNEIESDLRLLAKIGSWLNGKGVSKALSTAEIFSLWDKFDVYSASLVTYLLDRILIKKAKSRSKLVKESVESNLNRKRLIRYRPFSQMLQKYLPDRIISPAKYTWDCPISLPKDENQPLTNWQTFHRNPFSLDWLSETWISPENWEKDAEMLTSHSAFQTHHELDAAVCAHQLWLNLAEQEKSIKGVFLIYRKIVTDGQLLNSLETLAHLVAETWFEFIALNPQAFLDLSPDERHALAAYLSWHVGSLAALILRLKRLVSLLKNAHQPKKYQFLFEILDAEASPYSKDCLPADEQLLDWLGLRPPGLEDTVLVLQYSVRYVVTLEAYRDSLLKRGFFIKEFICQSESFVSHLPVLHWTEASLMLILSLRIRRSTTAYEYLTSLFDKHSFSPMNWIEADEILAHQSQGSLTKMLFLGGKILKHHLQKHPEAAELSKEDFDVIYQP